jgi:hypothetical protein
MGLTSTTHAVDATGSSDLNLQALRLARHGLVVVADRVAWRHDCSGSGDRGDHEPNEEQQSKTVPDHRYPSFPVSRTAWMAIGVPHRNPRKNRTQAGPDREESGIVPVPRAGGSPDIGPPAVEAGDGG